MKILNIIGPPHSGKTRLARDIESHFFESYVLYKSPITQKEVVESDTLESTEMIYDHVISELSPELLDNMNKCGLSRRLYNTIQEFALNVELDKKLQSQYIDEGIIVVRDQSALDVVFRSVKYLPRQVALIFINLALKWYRGTHDLNYTVVIPSNQGAPTLISSSYDLWSDQLGLQVLPTDYDSQVDILYDKIQKLKPLKML